MNDIVNTLCMLNTPRYLSYYIAMLEAQKKRGVLIIIGNIHFLDEYLILLKQNPHPFVDILIFSAKYHNVKNNDVAKVKHRRSCLRKLDDVFAKYPIDTVINSNDGLLWTQYALFKNQHGKNIYLEDGTLNYLPNTSRRISSFSRFIQAPLHRWLYPKLYFKHWHPLSGIGDNPHINEIHLSFPKLNANLTTKTVLPLNKDYMSAQTLFSKSLLTYFSLSVETLKILDIVIILDRKREDTAANIYLNEMNKLARALSDKGLNLGIKKHPRDFYDYPEITALPNTTLLPPIAFENIAPFLSAHTVVIGYQSTALLLACWLLSNKQLICVNSANYSTENHINSLLKKLDIQTLTNEEQIFNALHL